MSSALHGKGNLQACASTVAPKSPWLKPHGSTTKYWQKSSKTQSHPQRRAFFITVFAFFITIFLADFITAFFIGRASLALLKRSPEVLKTRTSREMGCRGQGHGFKGAVATASSDEQACGGIEVMLIESPMLCSRWCSCGRCSDCWKTVATKCQVSLYIPMGGGRTGMHANLKLRMTVRFKRQARNLK